MAARCSVGMIEIGLASGAFGNNVNIQSAYAAKNFLVHFWQVGIIGAVPLFYMAKSKIRALCGLYSLNKILANLETAAVDAGTNSRADFTCPKLTHFFNCAHADVGNRALPACVYGGNNGTAVSLFAAHENGSAIGNTHKERNVWSVSNEAVTLKGYVPHAALSHVFLRYVADDIGMYLRSADNVFAHACKAAKNSDIFVYESVIIAAKKSRVHRSCVRKHAFSPKPCGKPVENARNI